MLLLDVGNTYTKWEIVAGDVTLEGKFPTSELLQKVLGLLIEYPNENSILASWVGNKESQSELELLLSKKGVTLRLVQSEKEHIGLINGYHESARLGVDRWLAMLGVWQKHRKAFCVVDAGTALTMDFVLKDGRHFGGYIIPGVRTMITSLNVATAQIDCSLIGGDRIDLHPGRNTMEAVQRGVVLTLVGSIEFATKSFAERFAISDFGCFIGGGDAELLAPILASAWQVEKSLVLSGLKTYLQNA